MASAAIPAKDQLMSDISDKHSPKSATYADAGVDIEAGNTLVDRIAPLAKSTARIGADSDLGGFGGLFDLAACKFDDPVLVAANDGVGTKLKIAIESGIHDTVGIDLVAMCVNDLIVQGAEPLFFLDYFASGKLDVDAATDVIAGIAEGCRQAGCALIGGETAEMPGMYAAGDYDLAGFSVGAAERRKILPRNDIGAGDIILGLTSNGLHSNGFSLVRKLVSQEGLAWDAPSPAQGSKTVAEELLTPTRIYVKAVLAALNANAPIKGLVHMTGGGFQENLPRVLPDDLGVTIDLQRIPALPIMAWLAQAGGISEAEMLKTFNCGIGMILAVTTAQAVAVEAALKAQGTSPVRLGEVTLGQGVTYMGQLSF